VTSPPKTTIGASEARANYLSARIAAPAKRSAFIPRKTGEIIRSPATAPRANKGTHTPAWPPEAAADRMASALAVVLAMTPKTK
jgi:hypothetical protein